MPTTVKILGGHFKGCVGSLKGYYYDKAIVVVPIKDVPSTTVLLSSGEYKTFEQEGNNVQS